MKVKLIDHQWGEKLKNCRVRESSNQKIQGEHSIIIVNSNI